MSRHRAFESSNNSQLELLAAKYNVKIIWCPKFHCELNPIEGFWCDLKWFVRKFNDQDFKRLNGLIIQGMERFEEKKLSFKLWRRLWKSPEMYHEGSSYQQVLQSLFGARFSATSISHQKNKDFNNSI